MEKVSNVSNNPFITDPENLNLDQKAKSSAQTDKHPMKPQHLALQGPQPNISSTGFPNKESSFYSKT